MKKIILCEGDSWTAGDIMDPKLVERGETNNHLPENDVYRLPKVWPYKLEKKLGITVLNKAEGGCSNDAIIRRITEEIYVLLDDYKPEEIFVIVGWTSPERKDFFIKTNPENIYSGNWEPFYPSQHVQNFSYLPKDVAKRIQEFFKTYVLHFWNEEEYITRYIQQNLFLHSFLENLKIDHLFFDAFYVPREYDVVFSHGMLGTAKLVTQLEVKHEYINKYMKRTTEKYLELRDSHFYKNSFRNFLLSKRLPRDQWVDGQSVLYPTRITFDKKQHHPSENGHELWAEELKKVLKKRKYA